MIQIRNLQATNFYFSGRDTSSLIPRSSTPNFPRFTHSLLEAPVDCQAGWHLCLPIREWSNVLGFSGINLSCATTPIRAGFFGTPSSTGRTANLPIILRVYNGLEPVPPATCYALLNLFVARILALAQLPPAQLLVLAVPAATNET